MGFFELIWRMPLAVCYGEADVLKRRQEMMEETKGFPAEDPGALQYGKPEWAARFLS